MNYPGVLPALTTPFAADGSVEVDALAANAAALLEAGCSGLVSAETPAATLPQPWLNTRTIS
jgi:dihydrodipicolinate synthase/N-acetylneuraminate lyase